MSGRVKPANIVNLLEYNPGWRIIGSRLRINKKLLGDNWFKELKVCVERLSEKAKHGVRK